MKKINVLSLFDGVSCGQVALERAGIKVKNYYASEIDKYAISITQFNYPNTIQLGDVTNWKNWDIDWSSIDLIIGGSPCTQISKSNTSKEGIKGLYGKESKLFFDFVDVYNNVKLHNKDVKFLLENVTMKKEYEDTISSLLGVNCVLINSSLVSAQSRKRLYWANFGDIKQPEDKKIMLKDIVFSDAFPVALHNLYGGFKEKQVRVFQDKSPTIRTAKGGGHIPSVVLKDLIHSEKAIEYMNRATKDGRTHWDFKHHSDINDEKSATVVANFFKGVPYNVFKDWNCIRKFHPIEAERLQTLDDNYTKYGLMNDKQVEISASQRFKAIGNGWTIDVISHIFNYLKEG